MHETIEPIRGVSLPFRDEAHKTNIVQGFHGPHGHNSGNRYGYYVDLSWAVDLGLPLGSLVTAARDGCVKIVCMGSDKYSLDTDYDGDNVPPSNLITVDHGNFQTLYGHLLKGSAHVFPGQRVSEGQVLARTGLSGHVGDIPNLHFQVFRHERRDAQIRIMRDYEPVIRTVRAQFLQTLPFEFDNYNGPLEHKLAVQDAA